MESIEELADSILSGVKDLASENAALRGEVERLERVSERLDKKLAEEYIKTMKLESDLSRYRDTYLVSTVVRF